MVKIMTYNQYYLCHHGILKQRWGVRRFQNPDGTLTEAGKVRYGKSSKKKDASVDYSKLNDDEIRIAKREAIGKGNIKEANKNIDYFSNEEIQDLINRFDMKRKVKNIAEKDIKTGKQKIEDLANYLGLAAKVSENGIRFYNSFAKASNSVLGTSMPIINNGDDNKKNNKNYNKAFDVVNNTIRSNTELKKEKLRNENRNKDNQNTPDVDLSDAKGMWKALRYDLKTINNLPTNSFEEEVAKENLKRYKEKFNAQTWTDYVNGRSAKFESEDYYYDNKKNNNNNRR